MRKTTRAFLPFAGVVAATLGLGACDISVGASEYSVREEKKFTVTAPVRLALKTFDGSIEVRGWDRNEVAVEVEKRGPDQASVDKIEVKATQDADTITVDVSKPSPLTTTGFRRGPSASLVVSVPAQTAVVARSGDGSITVLRVNGRIDVDTDDGTVRVEDVKGDLVVRTGDGAVNARQIDGSAKIDTGDGSVRAEGTFKGLSIETRDGSIDLTARSGSVVESEWTVTTGDGNVRLLLAEGLNADLDAQTADGRVEFDSGAGRSAAADEREDHDRSAVRSKLGNGGKLFRVRSGSGSISIRGW